MSLAPLPLPPPVPLKPKHLSSVPKRRINNIPPLADVGNTHGRTPDTPAKSTAFTAQPNLRPLLSPSSPRRPTTASPLTGDSSPPASPQSKAVPFPTIPEEEDEDAAGNAAATAIYVHNPAAEDARGREWAKEIARRQANIQELRGRKLRLEQAQAARPRKQSPSYHVSSALSSSSLDRKQSADDIEFLAALHASVVWRLWHADLSPTVFASERLLATRLHLVLMRHGRQNIPVPPIVAVAAQSHHSHATSNWTRHMIEKDRPGIQTLPQLVAKSMLRQKKQQGRRSPSRNGRLASRCSPQVSPCSSPPKTKGTSPLSKEAPLGISTAL